MSICHQCPRRCGCNRELEEKGICREGCEIRVSKYCLHRWEEPLISGSKGSGTIFFTGCSLSCVYCQNNVISHQGKGRQITQKDLFDIFFELKDMGATNINLVSPTHFSDAIRQAITNAKLNSFDLPIVWNTSGYETIENIKANEGLVDVYLTDMKYASSSLGQLFSGVNDYPEIALEAIEAMYSTTGDVCIDRFQDCDRLTKGVIVRHMIIPGHIDDSKKVLTKLFNCFSDRVLYSIMNQYTPTLVSRAEQGNVSASKILQEYPELGRSLTSEEYENVLDFADSIGMEDYFWQDGQTCKESYIPDF